MTVETPSTQADLVEVQLAFTHWRQTGPSGRGRGTPQRLRMLAVQLLSHYNLSQVCKALALNSTTLRQWAAQINADEPNQAQTGSGFIALDTDGLRAPEQTPPSPALSVRMELPNGVLVHVTGAFHLSQVLESAQALGSEPRERGGD